MSPNNDPDLEIDIWILNNTGILLFVRVDEFKKDEACITIDIANLPALQTSTKTIDVIEQGTLYGVKLYPNYKQPDSDFFRTHRLILKEGVLDFWSETDEDEEIIDITYTIKPKYASAVTDDDITM